MNCRAVPAVKLKEKKIYERKKYKKSTQPNGKKVARYPRGYFIPFPGFFLYLKENHKFV